MRGEKWKRGGSERHYGGWAESGEHLSSAGWAVCLCSDPLTNQTQDFSWWSPRGQRRREWWSPSLWGLTVLHGRPAEWEYFADPVPPALQPAPPPPSWGPVRPDLSCLAEADGRTAGRLRRGWGSCVIFDEGDGCQLFAELLQHDHPLQQSHVVDSDALWLQA